jgi:hypothetical protein
MLASEVPMLVFELAEQPFDEGKMSEPPSNRPTEHRRADRDYPT